ncbi:MAG: hypothetical protein ACE5FM_04630 [Methyloligellaceae bacterium]
MSQQEAYIPIESERDLGRNELDLHTWLGAAKGNGWTIGNVAESGQGEFISGVPPGGTRSIALRWVDGQVPADVEINIGNGQMSTYHRVFSLSRANSPLIIRVDPSDYISAQILNPGGNPADFARIRWGYSPGEPETGFIRMEFSQTLVAGVPTPVPEGALWATLGFAGAFTMSDGKAPIAIPAVAIGDRIRLVGDTVISAAGGSIVYELSVR